MDSLKLVSGKIRLAIENDEGEVTGELSFNPRDQVFAEKFYEVYKKFSEKQKDYESRAKDLDESMKEVDENGIPKRLTDGLAFTREVCEFMFTEIDGLFGNGTSKTVFGEVIDYEMIGQFFEMITPYFEKARSERMQKYTNKKQSRVMK